MTYDNWLASHYEPGGGYGGQSGSVRRREYDWIDEYVELTGSIQSSLADEVGTDDIRPTDGAVEET